LLTTEKGKRRAIPLVFIQCGAVLCLLLELEFELEFTMNPDKESNCQFWHNSKKRENKTPS